MKIPFEEHGAGKPVILLHAFPLSKKMWNLQIETLTAANCLVITPDLRGFGENHNFADINTMEDMAADIIELAETLKITKAVFVGLSMGGYVLLNLFRLKPEIFAGMILADTSAASDSAEKRDARYDLIDKIDALGSAALTENLLPKLFSDYTKKNNPDLVKKIEAEFSAVNPTGAAAALRGMAVRSDHNKLLDTISLPVQLIFGAEDKITNIETAKKMKNEIAGSNLTLISNAGHLPNLEQPELFNSVMRDFVVSVEI